MGFASRLRRFAALSAVALAGLSYAPHARADAEADAKDLFARGRDLRASGDCAGAATLFRKAWKIYPQGLGSLRNLAECEEAIGHFASSRRAWLDLKRALITMAPDPKYDGWEKDADDAAARLAPKVATMIVDVIVRSPEGEAPANERSGVHLFVNGEDVGPNLVGTPLERDPGTYRVRAQAPDAKPVEQSVSLQAGDTKRLTLRLVREPKPIVAAGGGVPGGELPAPEGSDTGKGRRTLGWVLTGVGGAALAGGFVTFLMRNAARSDLDAQCPTHTGCDPSLQSTVDRGKLTSTLTTILLPVGVVAAGVGVALVVTSRSPASSTTGKAPPPRRLVLAPSFGGVQLGGTF